MSTSFVPQKVFAVGHADHLTRGIKWDDGSDYDGVKKIYVRITTHGIQFVKFDYVKCGVVKQRSLDVVEISGVTHEIVVNYPEEYLIGVSFRWESSGVIKYIYFLTNQKSQTLGTDYFVVDDNRYSRNLDVRGNKIIGFHGSSTTDGYLSSLGAYTIPKNVDWWDDGKHTKVKKVQVTCNDEAIHTIQVTYDGSHGPALQSQLHGTVGSKTDEFTLESDEYITGLSAYGKILNSQNINVMTALIFTTNKRSYGFYIHKHSFQLSAPTGQQIIGFHGRSGLLLHSIGAHYAPITDVELDVRETEWDDGSDHDGVTKIYVRYDAKGIQWIKFDYVKAGNPIRGAIHGSQDNCRGSTQEIVINHPEEYLVSVEGWYDSSSVIMGIQFKTNQKTYEHIGYEMYGDDIKFTLQVQGEKIVGFHGSSGTHLKSITAYHVPITQKRWKIIPGVGGDGGTSWDDGVFDGVRTVYVGQGQYGIAMVEFVYDKGQVKEAERHGKRTRQIVDKFELDYPSEYIMEVNGTYDKILGSETDVITMLRFTTNKRISDPFGIEAGDDNKRITLKEEGHKIVGFHGSTSHQNTGDILHKIGVYVLPITS